MTLVLNMGLKSIRCIVFDANGNKLAFASLPIETQINGSRIEQDPLEWWTKAIDVINLSLRDLKVREAVHTFTVTASSACLVPVNIEGSAFGNAILVSDRRAVAESEYMASLPDFKAVREATGTACDPSLMLPKILWIKKHHPEIYNKTYKFLSPNDYFVAKVTGVFVTDELNATKYHYDLHKKAYPDSLLAILGISPETLPAVVPAGTLVGRLSPQIKKILHITQAVDVIVTTYDAICAFIGSGPTGIGEACDVSGTVTSVRAFCHLPVVDKKNRVFNTPLPSVGLNIIGGSNNLGGGLIEWAKQCLYKDEPEPYALMESEAKKSLAGANGLVFLPFLLGERAPLWNANARGVFFGLERSHSRQDLIRAVFDSTGFSFMQLLEVLLENKVPVDKVRLSGGLSRIDLVSQIKADVTGKEILVIDEFETTALGAAILAGIACGHYKSLAEASENCVRIRAIFEPDNKNHPAYEKIYYLYKQCYSALLSLFKERIEVMATLNPVNPMRLENL